jgi:hypothetical protein
VLCFQAAHCHILKVRPVRQQHLKCILLYGCTEVQGAQRSAAAQDLLQVSSGDRDREVELKGDEGHRLGSVAGHRH